MKTLIFLLFCISFGFLITACSKPVTTDNTKTSVPTAHPTQVVLNKPLTLTTDNQGFNIYSIEKLKLSFFYPPEWIINYDSFANPNYLEISKESSIVQIFYNKNINYSLTDQQKSRSTQTLNEIITIDGRQISANETNLDGGGMILTVNLPSLGKKPSLTIWFVTNDRAQHRELVIHMLETLKLN